jgi:hypothetical protein
MYNQKGLDSGAARMSMREVSIQDFDRDPAAVREDARYEPIAVTEGGARKLVIMSAEVFASLRRGSRRAVHVSEMTEDDIKAIENAKMPEGLEHLDALLDEDE